VMEKHFSPMTYWKVPSLGSVFWWVWRADTWEMEESISGCSRGGHLPVSPYDGMWSSGILMLAFWEKPGRLHWRILSSTWLWAEVAWPILAEEEMAEMPLSLWPVEVCGGGGWLCACGWYEEAVSCPSSSVGSYYQVAFYQ
jgi:hypothetical protein